MDLTDTVSLLMVNLWYLLWFVKYTSYPHAHPPSRSLSHPENERKLAHNAH